MTKTFTHNDVVRYLYDEIPTKEKTEFENAMIFNDELLGLFNEMSAAKRHLSDVVEAPSNRVIKNIVDYAKSLNLQGCNEKSDSRHS